MMKLTNSPNSCMLFKTFSSLLCPPPPPPSSTLTADDFATFFINKITMHNSSTPQLSNTSYQQTYTRSHPSLHSLAIGVASGLSSWTTSLLCLHGITRFCHSVTWLSYHCYADDTQLYLSFHPDDPTIATRISACLTET